MRVEAAAALAVQLHLEYAPQPPFESGTPETAPVGVLTAVTAKLAPGRKVREDIIATLTGK